MNYKDCGAIFYENYGIVELDLELLIRLLKCFPMGYEECLKWQRELNKEREEGKVEDIIIATEHPDTYTGGIHFKGDYEKYQVPILRVERGGNLTYHGPGQLVLYFIFNLKSRRMNVRDLILKVQDALVSTLLEYGVDAEGRLFERTGIWVEERKICSIGFAVRGSTTLHGIAININTDLRKFYAISPCDLDPGIMTSLQKEIGKEVNMAEFLEKAARNLAVVFGEEIDEEPCKLD
ncbi:MAG: lipoyl(octanoyl) transferase LipB [Thermoplasmatales archaeon]